MRALSSLVAQSLSPFFTRRATPLPHGSARQVLDELNAALGPARLAEDGIGDAPALHRLAELSARYGLNLSVPNAAAHLQPPPLAVSVAADTLANLSNGSLDTFDSGPFGIAVERWVISALADLAGFDPGADGVMTPGGSISNLMGLLLARDEAGKARSSDCRSDGVHALTRPVVFCSEVAHFSVNRACAILGLGEGAVRPIGVDSSRTIDPAAMERALANLHHDETPIAIIATAGTTDFGTVDPLRELAALAERFRVWFHVDAAYGFGARFSRELSHRLNGIERADSITLDLHKLGWQPAAASVLLVSPKRSFSSLSRSVDYLNPSDDADAGYDGLLGRSLQTTRRADAVKVAASFLSHGRSGLGSMVNQCHALARYAAQRIDSEDKLTLESGAHLTTVVFRYRAAGANPERENQLNGELRRMLLAEGTALIGRTSIDSRTCLKFTLINPLASRADVDAMVDAVLEAGTRCERALGVLS
ncbi:MAG: pyridoxal-dependent decarboxylase [Myxococcota bacterium]